MQINDLDAFLKNYIDGYLFTDLQTIKEKVPVDAHPGNAAYLMTGAICTGIELIGTLLTKQNIVPVCDTCHNPEWLQNEFPIDRYCKNYLAKVDPRYAALGPVVRELVRNGIMHSFATKGKIGITRRGERSTAHLVRMTQEGFLVINADFLFEDFKLSYQKYALPDLSVGGSKREQALKNYENTRKVYGDQIERTMKALDGKLDDWPREHKDVEYMESMVDEVEEVGYLPLVS